MNRWQFLNWTLRGVLAACTTRVAPAHARMVRSLPSDGAILREPPSQIELWFDELLDHEFNTISILGTESGQASKKLSLAKPQVDPKDRTHLTLTLPSLPPGRYVVEYRVLSRDGHSAPGRFSFTLRTAAGD